MLSRIPSAILFASSGFKVPSSNPLWKSIIAALVSAGIVANNASDSALATPNVAIELNASANCGLMLVRTPCICSNTSIVPAAFLPSNNAVAAIMLPRSICALMSASKSCLCRPVSLDNTTKFLVYCAVAAVNSCLLLASSNCACPPLARIE